MADRQVTASGKDKDGDITKLCKSGEAWSPRQKADAIRDIENGTHRNVSTTLRQWLLDFRLGLVRLALMD